MSSNGKLIPIRGKMFNSGITTLFVASDATKTSILTPTWMQINYPGNTSDPMKATVEKFGLRQENNRTFLCDKD
jgi:hypothetical protein